MTTTAGFSARRLLAHAVERGLPPASVTGWLGVSPAQLRPGGRVPAEPLYRAWASLSQTLADPAVGVRAALGWSPGDLELFGFCVGAAPTAGDAIDTAVRYAALVTESGQWAVRSDRDRDRDRVIVTWSRPGPPTLGRAIANEVTMTSFAAFFRQLTSASPIALELRHRGPGRSTAHAGLLGCPVTFGSDRDALVIRRAHMDIAPRQANPALWRYLAAIADETLAGLDARDVGTRVARAIGAMLDGGGGASAGGAGSSRSRAAVSAVARAIGMSERTLRRRLRDERTSFRAVLDGVRRARAAELLADPDARIGEIACEAGFADASAFGHAWRRWYGGAPSVMRRSRARARAS
jgi:AraC-like DNA-binding protein